MRTVQHDTYMKRCIDLAEKGLGFTQSNPLVGAVLVYEGRIIGEGYHQHFGGPHAEVNAINSVKPEDQALIAQSTIYVNLEPCSHHGKTPPCSDLIIEKKIPKVVIANVDPYEKVAGRGIRKLMEAGVDVVTGILAKEGEWLNRRFFTFHRKQRPYIILKWAQSADGFFTKNNDSQHWITGETAKRRVHRWRTEESAILVGTNTALVDNPQLTNRYEEGRPNPLRIVIDRSGKIPQTAHLLDGSTSTLVYTEMEHQVELPNVTCSQLKFDEHLVDHILNDLYQRDITSLIVEGGVNLLNQFIDKGLWNEARVFTGAVKFENGLPAPVIDGNLHSKEKLENDLLEIFLNRP